MPALRLGFPNNVPHGGGGGGYTTGAVSFDGSTALTLASLTSTDSTVASWSWWFQFPNGAFVSSGAPFADSDLNGSDANGFGFSNGPAIYSFLGNQTGSAFSELNYTDAAFVDESWHHVMFSVDVSGAGVGALVVDGVVVAPDILTFTGLPTTIQLNGLSFDIMNPTGFPWDAVNVADYWFAPGQSLIVGGVIPPATVAKFISAGKPVNLGADGSTPTGIAPAVFLRRAPSAAASTFANNLGTGGGPFTITGTLTNAPSSPSG